MTDTPAHLQERTLHRRAIEAAIWGIPAVNYDAMYQALVRDAKGASNQIVYWSRLLDWKNQTLTPNPTRSISCRSTTPPTVSITLSWSRRWRPTPMFRVVVLFLGFTFRARAARTKHGAMFVLFQPAISKDAQNKISGQIRRWRLHRWIGLNLAEIARQINPVVRGWMQYYRAFYRSALYALLRASTPT